MLLGVFLGNEREGFVNSLIGLGPGTAPPYSYGKRHLLPFGDPDFSGPLLKRA